MSRLVHRITVPGPYLHVKCLVYCERPGLTETLATVLALKGLLLGVNVAVISQVILTTKCFAANITGKRPGNRSKVKVSKYHKKMAWK